jgi:hypothetical protein
MTRATELTAEYLMRKIEAEPLPRFLTSPPVQDGPDRVSPLEAVAGFAVVAIVIFIFGWVL